MSFAPAATIVLTRAAERADRRLEFHRKLPTGGRHKMIDALLCGGLIVQAKGDYRLGDGAVLIEDSATGLMLTTLALTMGLQTMPPTASIGTPSLHRYRAECPITTHFRFYCPRGLPVNLPCSMPDRPSPSISGATTRPR